MSNNPLEAVTQAVNSLVTALKLPDESAKANEVLGEMSFPQFSRLLPYRDYNQESGLFMNDTTMGFMLEAIPINGANKSIVEALDHMLRTKLPRGIPLCIHLMSSQLVGDRIEYGLREFSWSGEQAERFNAITRAYYMKAAATQFPLPEGMNLPLTLRHYRVFISYCSPSKKKSRADILEMENLVKIIRASLQGASIATQTVDAQAFIDIVGEMINHNPDSLYRYSVHPESWLKFPGRSSWRVRRKLHGRRGAVVLMATRRRISPGRFHRSLLPISMISSIKRPVFLLTVAVFMNRTQFWITVNGYAFLFRSSFRMGVTGLKYCA